MTGSEKPDRDFIIYATGHIGSGSVPPRPTRLVAGSLTADFSDGNLRSIRFEGVEVLRGVSFLVRDRDWGTYNPAVSDLVTNQRADGFDVSYTARCAGPDNTDLAIKAKITGDDQGHLIFEAETLSQTGFETNRCGFCILHPIVDVAGTPVTVEHVDGTVVQTQLPDLIEPWQPFKDMRAIAHSVMADVTAECRMEGDTFEMEDQRNWSDASYKTYVRPLALPWPYRIEAGAPATQRIVLTIHDRRGNRAATPARQDEPVRLSLGTSYGKMPDIGVVVTPEEAEATLAASGALADLGARELLFHFDPLAGHGAKAIESFAALNKLHSGSSTLEIAVPCQRDLRVEMQEIAAMMQAVDFRPDAVFASPSVDRQSTPPGSIWPECPPLEDVYAAARAAFADLRLGGGMLSYFTELNRKRVPADQLDFISHCTNPIVHAADDLSVMQTLEALPFITKSVRAIYGDMPYRIGPSTIPMRQNPYGSRTMDNPAGERIAMANTDPRHNGLFGAAFALGYAARVIPAGLERLTLSALTGSFGLIAAAGEPVAAGGMRPLFHVIRTLARLSGRDWIACNSSDPARILALATGEHGTIDSLCLVNVTPVEQSVDMSALRLTATSSVLYSEHNIEGAPLMLDASLTLPAFSVLLAQTAD